MDARMVCGTDSVAGGPLDKSPIVQSRRQLRAPFKPALAGPVFFLFIDLQRPSARAIYKRFFDCRLRGRFARSGANSFLWRANAKQLESMVVSRFEGYDWGQRSTQGH